MEDFDSELNKIIEWELSERHKLEEEALKKYGRGYDGVPPEKYKELKDKSIKKAEELKKKYGKEITITAQETGRQIRGIHQA
jgi:hypothetical protein